MAAYCIYRSDLAMKNFEWVDDARTEKAALATIEGAKMNSSPKDKFDAYYYIFEGIDNVTGKMIHKEKITLSVYK